MGREECLYRIFRGDQQAFDDCTQQINDLIYKWLVQIRAECSENPVCVRFDMLCKYVAPGKARVMVGELTELGGCFLGWPEGPQTVFSAILDSYFGRLSASVTGPQQQLARNHLQVKNQPAAGSTGHTDGGKGSDQPPDSSWIEFLNCNSLPGPVKGAIGPTNQVAPPPKPKDQEYNEQQQAREGQNNTDPQQQQQQQNGGANLPGGSDAVMSHTDANSNGNLKEQQQHQQHHQQQHHQQHEQQG